VDLTGVWCWGSPRRSADTPFLRISRVAGRWRIETKDYMHANFHTDVRDMSFANDTLDFSYWYQPLRRWSHCSFKVSGETMAGQCGGELDAHTWGATPSYLWRSAPSAGLKAEE
jgi:hypothetical protein